MTGTGTMVLRLGLAALCGGAIGLEREYKGRPAGFRTYMLVALGAAVTMLLSGYLYGMVTGSWARGRETMVLTDVSRLGAQVINGVGFLGAGTILVTGRQEVRGLTTAAGLWASASLGLAIGAGFYECVVLGAGLILVSAGLFSRTEERLMRRVRNMNVYMELEGAEAAAEAAQRIRKLGIEVYDTELCGGEGGKLSIVMSLRLGVGQRHNEVLAEIASSAGVELAQEI